MSSRIISFELVVMFFEIGPQQVAVDTVLFRYFLASFCAQAFGRWIEFQ